MVRASHASTISVHWASGFHGEGAKFASLSQFATLKSEHARFHQAVGEVIRRADKGESVKADLELGAKSDFGKASSAVVIAIMDLKKHVPVKYVIKPKDGVRE